MTEDAQGLVFFGPGSEWFWSIVSNAILVVTLAGLYLQVRAQRASAILEQFTTLTAQWEAKEFRYRRLYALIDLEHRSPSEGLPAGGGAVAMWFEVLGSLVRKGHVHAEDVAATFAEAILAWWAIMGPHIEQDRATWDAPAHFSEFEALARRMEVYWSREFHRPYEMIERVAERIDALREDLIRQQAMERGEIPDHKEPAATGAGA